MLQTFNSEFTVHLPSRRSNTAPADPVCRLLSLAGVKARPTGYLPGYGEIFSLKGLPIRLVLWDPARAISHRPGETYELARRLGATVLALHHESNCTSDLPLTADLVLHDRDWDMRLGLVPAVQGSDLLLVPKAGDREVFLFNATGLVPLSIWPWQTPEDCELAILAAARDLDPDARYS